MKKVIQIISSLLVLGIIVIYTMYSIYDPEYKDITAEVRANAPGEFIELSQGFTHYELAGPDTSALVVLVHGYSVPYYIWDTTFEFLLSKGFRVLRYSTIGRGLSTRIDGDYDNEAYRTQLNDLVTALGIKDKFTIAGLSFGGPVVADYALHYPKKIKNIIFIDPAYRDLGDGESELLMDISMALDETKRAEGQLDDVKYPENYPEWPDLYRETMYYKGHRRSLISTFLTYKNVIENYAALNKYKFNILLIWGEDDHVVPFELNEQMRQNLEVDFKPIPDAAHLPHLEKAGIVNPMILDFLQK